MEWPPEEPSNSTWRVVVSVSSQQRGIRRWINDHVHRELFKLPTVKHTIRSTEVDASVPFVMPK